MIGIIEKTLTQQDEMGGSSSTYGRKEECVEVIWWESQRERD
jgi:hypothetical protein